MEQQEPLAFVFRFRDSRSEGSDGVIPAQHYVMRLRPDAVEDDLASEDSLLANHFRFNPGDREDSERHAELLAACKVRDFLLAKEPGRFLPQRPPQGKRILWEVNAGRTADPIHSDRDGEVWEITFMGDLPINEI